MNKKQMIGVREHQMRLMKLLGQLCEAVYS